MLQVEFIDQFLVVVLPLLPEYAHQQTRDEVDELCSEGKDLVNLLLTERVSIFYLLFHELFEFIVQSGGLHMLSQVLPVSLLGCFVGKVIDFVLLPQPLQDLFDSIVVSLPN